MIPLKPFQEEAVGSILAVFGACAVQLRAVSTPGERAAAIAHNGGVLLQAPTGAGKTLVAGTVAERLSLAEPVVWLWFAPFKGLTGQTEGGLRDHFPQLRVRDLAAHRVASETRRGDVFVATWQSVAAANADSRKVRQDAETGPALESFLMALRAAGFRLGVVVDEAHHGFGKGTQALRFYGEVLRPEFTLLVTATPDDADAEAFRKAAGFATLHRCSVSRADAVAAGLLKPAVKSVAFVAPDDKRMLIDFEAAALTEGVRLHVAISTALEAAKINLKPLLLVQVDSKAKDAPARVRQRLVELGIREDRIATHTADEPDDNLLALAHDEEKEVLVFKMAVALGFDAPRAFALVSMRGVADVDFGTQIVGRILRVHARCQGRDLPPLLRHAYVILADSAAQAGLATAAQKVDAVRTELARAADCTVLVQVAGQTQLQIVKGGQTWLLPSETVRPVELPELASAVGGETAPLAFVGGGSAGGLASQSVLFQLVSADARPETGGGVEAFPGAPAGGWRYPRRADAPAVFLTQKLPTSTDDLARCIAANLKLEDKLIAGLARQVDVLRIERELFKSGSLAEENREMVKAVLSLRAVEEQAQMLLLNLGYVDPRELHQLIVERVKTAFFAAGVGDVANDEDRVEAAVSLILVRFPQLLRDAERECCAKHATLTETEALPEALHAVAPLPPSMRNLYRVMPEGLNSWERDLAEKLDNDLSGAVLWWHRNEPHKPWSVCVTRPNGKGYYPDFVIGVKGRKTPDGIVLLETKGAIHSPDSQEKAQVEHKRYGRVLMLHWENRERWMTVRHDPAKDRNLIDAVFRLDALAEY